MAYLIDTCVLQHLIAPDASQKFPRLVARVAEMMRDDGGLHICAVSAFEMRRGLKALALRGDGRSKARRVELLLQHVVTLGLDSAWSTAEDIYAFGATHKPAITLSDGDLLIAACAFAHQRVLVTSDKPLAKNLADLGYGAGVVLLDLA